MFEQEIDHNAFNQPVGQLIDWQPPQWPPANTLRGRYAALERLRPEDHTAPLWNQIDAPQHDALWTYLPYGPFPDPASFSAWMTTLEDSTNALFYVIHDLYGQPLGQFALSSIDRQHGVVELAHVLFSPALKQSTIATEAVYLLLEHIFTLGFRRCFWKCNALNQGSRHAAVRFGFQFEGVFRQAMVVKGRNRDTAWFGMTHTDWRRAQDAYSRWLDAANFHADGKQKQSLRTLMRGNQI
ncbi:GNAT family N-acetyltransferase [Teredinibacter turnerae]|uniref:GNAT family N-acetyltransferase n=1 Tax=Teredinibacter turnerae TaxID=2426 RepID=UPI0005F798B6|nr:GNAT family protein [Teredinibacter turnerae]